MSRSFNQVADRYDETRAIPPIARQAIAATIARSAALGATSRLLEVGVGTGRIALPLITAGYRLVGVDLATQMLAVAQERAIEQADRLLLVRASATELPFPDGQFDAALIVHVLHLIPDWQAALAESLRVIRPGGRLLYGSEQSERAGTLHEVHQHWRDILAAHSVTLRNHQSGDDAILAAMRDRGLALATTTAARWRTAITVEALLERYRARVYSSSWSIPEAIFPLALEDLTAWVRARFPDPATILTGELCFALTVAQARSDQEGWRSARSQ